MHNYLEQNALIIDILLQIAHENRKDLESIKNLLLIVQDDAVNLRFWELLDIILPGNSFQDVGCSSVTTLFELRL